MLFAAILAIACLAVVCASVSATHVLGRRIVRRALSEPESPSVCMGLPFVLLVWSFAAMSNFGYEAWRGWSHGESSRTFNELAHQAHAQAEDVAKSRGEAKGGGPIYQAEYGSRYVAAEMQARRAMRSPLWEQINFYVWPVAAMVIAITYYFTYCKRCGRSLAIAIALALASGQFLVVGAATMFFSTLGYLGLGGPL